MGAYLERLLNSDTHDTEKRLKELESSLPEVKVFSSLVFLSDLMIMS